MKNIISLGFIVASVGVFFLFVKPEYAAIQGKRQELKSYQDTLDQVADLEKTIARLQGKADSIDPKDMEKLNKMLPDSISNVKLIIDISNIAESSNLEIKSIGLAQTDAKGDTSKSDKASTGSFDSVDISFNVDANYTTFKSFLSSLEKSLRIVDIVGVSFSPTDTTNDIYKYKVTLRTYWLKK